MECCILLSPEGECKFPDGVNGGSHPLVRGEGVAGVPVSVVGVDGLFPVVCYAASEELIPSNFVL